MSDDSVFKKIGRELRESVEQTADALGERARIAGHAVASKAHQLAAVVFGQHVTVYPAYGYRDLRNSGIWSVPLRVWVHDNRDTPMVEEALERWAVSYFERDLGRVLSEAEKARLEASLACFIADDKNNEEVEFTFANDPDARAFRLTSRTTPNGVIEEHVVIPETLVAELYARQTDGSRWLKIHARTTDGHGSGDGAIRFLEPDGWSLVSDIDDTVKVTHVPAGKKTVLRNVFLKEFRAAEGMRERYAQLVTGAGENADMSFHYVSGSPWQLYHSLSEFLIEKERFPAGTFHMKNLRKNLFEPGALDSIRAFALGGDLATLDQKIRQITNLLIHLPRRKFILVGDSGEKDPEVYRAMRRMFPDQVQRIIIRDVLCQRLDGMELITGADVPVALDTAELEAEMLALVAQAREEAPRSEKL